MDKVIQVLEPIDTVDLTYNPDNDDRLAFVETNYPDYNGVLVSQIIKLGYQDYLNSKDRVDNVVTTVEQRTFVREKNQKNVKVLYDQEQMDEKYYRLQAELDALRQMFKQED